MAFSMAAARARRFWLAVSLGFFASCASTKTVPTEGPPRSTVSDPFRDLLVPSDACVSPPPGTISRRDALADLELVERILRQGYAGFDVLTRSGLDWADVFRVARATVDGLTEPISVEDLRNQLLKTFSVTRDGHLAFWTVTAEGKWQWGSAGAHQDAFAADVVLGRAADGSWTVRHSPDSTVLGSVVLDCEGYPLEQLLRLTAVGGPPEPAWLLVRMSVTPPGPLTCRLRSNDVVRSKPLAFHRLRVSEPKIVHGTPVFEQSGREILRLRLRNLGDMERASMEAFVATSAMARNARAVILDVRGNPGGSDSFVRDWFTGLTTGPLRYSVMEELQSDVTLQGAVNWLTCKLASKRLEADARSVEQDLSEATKDLEHAATRVRRPYRDWSVRNPTDQGQAPTPFTGALVVLVDAACASSCESLVMYARQIPRALIVGENTAGVGVFGEVRPYRLPRSGIWMQAGRKWFHDPDPSKVAEEGTGYLPDIWIDSEKAEAAAEVLAGCLVQEECRSRFQESVRGSEAAPTAGVSLRALSYSGATLEGEVLNQDGPVAKEIVVEVTFRDATGNPVSMQEFKIVPGGDGKPLRPRTAKHFKYRVEFGSTARTLSVSGRVSRTVPVSP